MPNRHDSTWLVVTACDDRYLWPWACALYSAVLNADVPLRFALANVNGLLSPEGEGLAKQFFAFLEVDGEIVDVSLDIPDVDKYQWNATIFARLSLMDKLSERFLWLDSDTILCSGWTEIFDAAENLMDDAQIIACAVSDRPATLDWLHKEDTNAAFRASKGIYVNTGVVLVDPLRWRDGGMDRVWIDLIGRLNELGFDFPDQDIVNYLLAGKIGLLSSRFNHLVSEPTDGRESILHFAGSPKPWRLTRSGRAFYIVTEVSNFDQTRDPMWGNGQAWELFPRYWEVERALMASLRESHYLELASALSRHRDAELTSLPLLQRIKFFGMRLLSRQLLSR